MLHEGRHVNIRKINQIESWGGYDSSYQLDLSFIDSFNQSVTELGEHAQSRYDAVLTCLSGK